MGDELRGQLLTLRGAEQRRTARAGTGQARPGAGALAHPAVNGGGIVLKECGDVSHAATGIHGGQGSFTDIVGGVRALHDASLPDWHNLMQPL